MKQQNASILHRCVRFACAAVAGLFAFAASATDYDLKTDTVDPLALTADDTCTNTDEETKDLTFNTATDFTCAAKIMGNIRVVKTGGGTLVMSAENTYTGGTVHSGGKLQAGNTSAFGATTLPIVLNATAAALQKDCFYGLVLPNGTYGYDIDRTTSELSILWLGGDVVFNGNIGDSTEAASGSLLFTQIANVNSGHTNTFNGTVTLPKANLVSCCYHNNAFNKTITAKQIQTKTGESSSAGTFYPVSYSCDGTFILNAANDIDALWIRANGITANAAGAFGDGSAYLELSSQVYGNGKMTLGADQTIAYVTGKPDTVKTTSNSPEFTSSSPRTLTIAGTRTAASGMAVNGQVSLVYAPTGDFTQTFASNRVNKTTGSLTALTRGTLELGGTTTWKNVPTVTAGAGARVLVSTTEAGALSGVRTLNVTGTVEVAQGLANPFTGLTALNVTSASSVKLPSGTALTLSSLTIDGKKQFDGTYQGFDWLSEGVTITVAGSEWTKAEIEALTEGVTIPASKQMVIRTVKNELIAFSKKISGDGSILVLGDGEIVFSAANDYTGGLFIDGAATVRGTDGKAFGTGAVQLGGYKSSVRLNTGTATFANDFTFTNKAVLAFVPKENNSAITVGGTVTASSDFFVSLSDYGVAMANTGCSYEFKGPINAAGKAMTFTGNASKSVNVNFRGSITAARVRSQNLASKSPYDSVFGNNWGYCGNATYFFYAANAVDVFVPYYATFTPKHSQAFTGISTLSASDYRQGDYHHGGTVNFSTSGDMEVSSIQLLDDKSFGYGEGKYTGGNGVMMSANPMTLTVSGGGSYRTDWKLTGSVSLNWNPPDAGDTLILSNMAHTTNGKLTVSKGTVVAGGAKVSFKNLTAIEVKEGATFKLDTAVADALSAVTSIIVQPGGTLEIARGATPFGTAKATVEIMTNGTAVGTIRLAQDVVAKFALVRVNCEAVPNATYTSSATWLEGAGSVQVDSTVLAENVWKNAKSDAWETAANWSKNKAPSTDYATAINAAGVGYTVSLTANAGTIGQLRVENPMADQTTTLNVAAPVKVDYNTDAVNVGKGALVKIATNGTFTLSRGTQNDSSAVRVNVHDGGEFKVCGGTAVFLNCAGKVWAGNGGKIAIASGALLTRPSAWTSKAPYSGGAMTVDDGGTLELTGGELRFAASGWGSDGLVIRKGGTLDVSGDAVVGPLQIDISSDKAVTNQMTYSRVFGDGKMTFRENSTFGTNVTGGVGGWGYCFATGSGAPTGTVTFLEHARFYDTSSSLKLDRGAGTVAQLHLYSDATNQFNWATYLGGGDGGRGEVVITNGVVTQGGPGLRLGGAYEKQGSTKALNSEGYLRVAGKGAANVYGGNTATGDFCGLIVGDGVVAVTNKTTGLCYEDHMTGYLELADSGAITFGSQAAFIVGVGNTNVFGRFTQTGGTFTDTSESPYGRAVVGMGGGTGEWLMSGGYAFIKDCLFVGGASCTNDFHRTRYPYNGGRLYVGERDYPGQAKGLLKLTGGTMTVKKDLILSKDGEGTLELGPNANLVVEGKLDAKAGSKLVVDMSGCTDQRKTLATFGGTTNAFDAANITLKQDSGTSYELRISPTAIRVVQPVGLIMMIK